MLSLSPIVTSYKLLPSTSSTSFFSSETPALKPSSPESTNVYEVVEDMSGSDESGAGSWRGGWAKRFIPDSISYETSIEPLEDGMRSITHAPMGVHSVTVWCLKFGEGEGGLVLEERGKVTSNRMLMGFIKTTLQESHEKMVREFMIVLEKSVAGGEREEVQVEKVT